ncbi:zinc-ribbon domain-containing protein, partial [Longimicrobium sp.]
MTRFQDARLCATCGKDNPDDAKTCSTCGADIS